jgi:hypothetical protein
LWRTCLCLSHNSHVINCTLKSLLSAHIFALPMLWIKFGLKLQVCTYPAGLIITWGRSLLKTLQSCASPTLSLSLSGPGLTFGMFRLTQKSTF